MAQVQDIVSFARILLNSVGGASARLTDPTAIVLCDRALKDVMSDILFPDTRITIVTIPNQQGYSLPEVYEIHRVYVAGQAIVPTNLDTLEGTQTLTFDQSATGVQIVGSDGPPGGGGLGQSQWSVQAPVAYPFVNNWGSPAPMAQPWFPGQRPRYYLRGGLIGIVPAPANSVDLVIDCVAIPAKVQNLTDAVVIPDNFIEAVAWKMCTYAKFADDSDRSSDQRNFASGEFQKQIRALRTWKRTYTGDNSGPKVLTYRGGFRIGSSRSSNGSGPGDF